MALANVSDLEGRMGRPLTGPETMRAEVLLDDASALVRSYTNQSFQAVDDETLVIKAQQGEIRLPQRPVRGVTQVYAIGAGGAPDIPVVGWQWDGLDIIRTSIDSPLINLPERWYDEDATAYPGTFRVTYSHGAPPPPEVVAVTAGMVLRTLTAPSMAGGVTGETIGPYSYRTDGSGVGTAVLMTNTDRQTLKRFRRTSAMSMVRFR
jgi:hypothetical protein